MHGNVLVDVTLMKTNHMQMKARDGQHATMLLTHADTLARAHAGFTAEECIF